MLMAAALGGFPFTWIRGEASRELRRPAVPPPQPGRELGRFMHRLICPGLIIHPFRNARTPTPQTLGDKTSGSDAHCHSTLHAWPPPDRPPNRRNRAYQGPDTDPGARQVLVTA